MSSKRPLNVLCQRWVHSHEEDTDSEMVFRPASFEFPRSRGRASFELRPDGTLTKAGPGPADRPRETSGRWKLDADGTLTFDMDSPSEPSRAMRIASASKTLLVLEK